MGVKKRVLAFLGASLLLLWATSLFRATGLRDLGAVAVMGGVFLVAVRFGR